jgi:hypothetical protein
MDNGALIRHPATATKHATETVLLSWSATEGYKAARALATPRFASEMLFT